MIRPHHIVPALLLLPAVVLARTPHVVAGSLLINLRTAAVQTPIPAFISFDTRTLDLGNINRALTRRDTTLVAVNTGGASDSIAVTLDNVNLPTDSAVAISPQSFSLAPGESRPIVFTIFPRFLQTDIVYYSAIVLTTTRAAGPNGREVAQLVNGRMAPGSYSVRFDGSSRASGVYVYRPEAGNFTYARRMVLLR